MTSRALRAFHLALTLATLTAAQAASAGAGDFDGDGSDDVLLRHERTGAWRYQSFTDGATPAHALGLPTDAAHRFRGIGDFNGDGRHDVLFQSREDGAWLYYTVEPPGSSPGVARREDIGAAPAPGFELRGIGDLNGDGHHDLVFRNTDTGAWRVYFMDETGSSVHDGLRATTNRKFAVKGIGDLNGDGRDDVLLRHVDTGAWISYEVNASGRGLLRRPPITRNRAYGLAGIGDLNGDARDDVLLRHRDSGRWIQYEMNGARAALRRISGMTREDAYRRVAIGDFNGDGIESVLVRHGTNGDWVEYGVSGTTAVATRDADLARDLAWRGAADAESTLADRPWTTADGRIVLEVAPGEVTATNPFDLNDRSVFFTPDGEGGYTREVREVEWDSSVGDEVIDGAEVQVPFAFEFGGQTRTSVTVRLQGVLTFDGTFQDPYWDMNQRFSPMTEHVRHFALSSSPVIATLWKPWASGSMHVATQADRMVVTWSVTDWMFHEHGVPPQTRSEFQAVLHADGRVAFHYRNTDLGDGIVGLFTGGGAVKGDQFARIDDPTDTGLAAHLDITNVTFHQANLDVKAGIVVEFTTRGPIPAPASGVVLAYRIYFDTDEPHWTQYDWRDTDLSWEIVLRDDGTAEAWTGTVLPRQHANRIALWADATALGGISGSVVLEAAQWDNGTASGWSQSAPTLVSFPIPPPRPGLSEADAGARAAPHEAFHFRSMTDLGKLGCRVIEQLGDGYDLLVFHSEFRMDAQEDLTPWRPYRANVATSGVGVDGHGGLPPCASNRLKGQWVLPVWIKAPAVADDMRPSVERFERGSFLFAHEFTHSWTAYLSFAVGEALERLYGVYCNCHWRDEIDAPAAFAWRTHEGNRSVMGGEHWRENTDGTFSRMSRWEGGGFSWLDLYAMGLASASEVPDTFLLRNMEFVDLDADGRSLYSGTKEVLTIDQIIAAAGPRLPAVRDAQTVFNAGFVYLTEPGQTPDRDMLALHGAYRDQVVADWAAATGGRSEITTRAPDPATLGVGDRSPVRDGRPGHEPRPVQHRHGHVH